MASSIFAPLQQILASDGTLGNGLQVFVYQTGTTTKINTYPTAADADAATNANTNPLVLNSRGETPAAYVPDSVQTVKLVLALSTDTDPPSSPITTRDGVIVRAPHIKNNDAATTAPTTGDDSDDGYSVGSRWTDVTNDLVYLCVDASVGAAVWQLIPDVANGTWTAVVQGSSTAGTYEIASQISTYYRIGKMYFVSGAITMAGSLTGSGSGNLQISGLPATKKANMAPRGSVDLRGHDLSSSVEYAVCAFESDSSASALIEIAQIADNTTASRLPISAIAANDVMTFSIAYEVA